MSFELNQDIEATAFAGEVRADIKVLQTDVTEVKGDVKHIRSTVDQAAGAWKVTSAVGAGLGSLGALVSLLNVFGVFDK